MTEAAFLLSLVSILFSLASLVVSILKYQAQVDDGRRAQQQFRSSVMPVIAVSHCRLTWKGRELIRASLQLRNTGNGVMLSLESPSLILNGRMLKTAPNSGRGADALPPEGSVELGIKVLSQDALLLRESGTLVVELKYLDITGRSLWSRAELVIKPGCGAATVGIFSSAAIPEVRP